MFLRATESVFITLAPNKKLFLTRKENYIDETGKKFRVFEIATCVYCHAIYIVGKDNNGYLEQDANTSEESSREFYLLDKISDTDEDHLMDDENINAETYKLCPYCGLIQNTSLKQKKPVNMIQ